MYGLEQLLESIVACLRNVNTGLLCALLTALYMSTPPPKKEQTRADVEKATASATGKVIDDHLNRVVGVTETTTKSGMIMIADQVDEDSKISQGNNNSDERVEEFATKKLVRTSDTDLGDNEEQHLLRMKKGKNKSMTHRVWNWFRGSK